MRYGMFIDLDRCAGCTACIVACKQENGTPGTLHYSRVLVREVGEYPNASLAVIPTGCMHCENAPCVQVCPVGASYYENGMVLVDQERCIGCRACVNACPFGARTYNHYDPLKQLYYEGQEPTPFEQAKAAQHLKGTVEKCTFCVHRVKEGLLPACVLTCVAQARVFGDLDDPDSELVKIIRERNARPLNPEAGTVPHVFYAGSF